MKFPNRKTERKKEIAADWVLRGDQGMTADEEARFIDWKEGDPEGKALAQQYQDTWDRLDALKGLQNDLAMELDPLSSTSPSKMASLSKRLAWVGAAAVLAIGFFFALSTFRNAAPAIAVESRIVDSSISDYYELPDGSIMELNEDTEVEYRYTPTSRDFWVNRGEIYFTVAKDAVRPFNVVAQGSQIQAVGTQFNVKLFPDSVEVLVTEGLVQVGLQDVALSDARSLAGGVQESFQEVSVNQKATIQSDAKIMDTRVFSISVEDVDQALAWKPVTLRFSNTPLREVVEAFNAHNDTQLAIIDGDLEDLRIDVTFRSNKLEGFVRLIEATNDVVSRKENGFIYLSKRP